MYALLRVGAVSPEHDESLAMRDRVSDREKFFIDFTYDRQVTGNLEKAYQTLELWNQTYPRGGDMSAQSLFAGISGQGTGRFERARESAQQRIASDPDVVFGYSGLAHSFFFTDRFSEAESTFCARPTARWTCIFSGLRYTIRS